MDWREVGFHISTPAANNIGFYTRQGYLIRNPNPEGTFQCAIPMRHIFGFLDDYSKVTYGMRDTLQLIRKDDNDALSVVLSKLAWSGKDDNDALSVVLSKLAWSGKDDNDALSVVLSKLAWSVPIVQPNEVRKVNLYKSIAANNVIPVSFRMRQCEKFSLPQARASAWRLGVSSAPEKPRCVLVVL